MGIIACPFKEAYEPLIEIALSSGSFKDILPHSVYRTGEIPRKRYLFHTDDKVLLRKTDSRADTFLHYSLFDSRPAECSIPTMQRGEMRDLYVEQLRRYFDQLFSEYDIDDGNLWLLSVNMIVPREDPPNIAYVAGFDSELPYGQVREEMLAGLKKQPLSGIIVYPNMLTRDGDDLDDVVQWLVDGNGFRDTGVTIETKFGSNNLLIWRNNSARNDSFNFRVN